MSPLPLVRADAPGRVNLIGEHLDYNGGRCLPIAIDRRTRATVSASPDDRIHLRSGALTWSGAVGERAEQWAAYVVGVLEALRVTRPLSIAIRSDVPIGAGLSSSAALECSVALAVDACLALGRSRDALVEACREAETTYVGVSTGGLDQTVALHARGGHALLLDFAENARTPVPWAPEAAGLELLVIDTGVRHALADGRYAERRATCEAAARTLGLDLLARATVADLERLDGEALRRARHVVGEQARVTAFTEALAADAWADAGALMNASHASLRDDFEVSCPELDLAVVSALEAGAAGARMTGGGFGGSAIALVPAGRTAVTEAAVTAAFARNGYEAPTVFSVGASQAGQVLAIT